MCNILRLVNKFKTNLKYVSYNISSVNIPPFFLEACASCLRSLSVSQEACTFPLISMRPVHEVIKLEFVLKLKIKSSVWLRADTCPQAAKHCALFWVWDCTSGPAGYVSMGVQRRFLCACAVELKSHVLAQFCKKKQTPSCYYWNHPIW